MKSFALVSALLSLAATAQASAVNYTTVKGYFLQDETSTDDSSFDYTAVNFGLINRTYPADRELENPQSHTQWERFYHQVQRLNANSSSDVEYKVLFLGRHGEGWHNVAESYYGTPAWNVSYLENTGTFAPFKQIRIFPGLNSGPNPDKQCYWAEKNGNGTANWRDASLTKAGEAQALKAHDFWQSRITTQRIHTPDAYFVSPLTRTLQTANLTFTGLPVSKNSARFTPLIKELFREGISIHTCDHRRNRTYIHNLFPTWPIEPGFSEEDALWNGITAETSSAQDARSAQALGDVFFTSSKQESSKDSKQQAFISVTSHSGEISSILRVLRHRTFSLNTGAVIPALVRAEKKNEDVPTSSAAWTVSPHCTAPPVSSAEACVCSSAAPVTTPLVTGA